MAGARLAFGEGLSFSLVRVGRNDVERNALPPYQGVASFHLDKLIPDLYSNDSTLVVSPCNSPEQAPITFGAVFPLSRVSTCANAELSACAHAQQLIWQLFNTIEKGFEAAGDTDTAFLQGEVCSPVYHPPFV